MKILVLNAGSSSQKSCLYDLPPGAVATQPLEPLWEAFIDWTVHPGQGELTVKQGGHKQTFRLPTDDAEGTLRARRAGIGRMLQTLVDGEKPVLANLADLDGVGHRVVHGGIHYHQATRITADVKQAIADLIPLAPAHNPAHVEGIEAIEHLLPSVPQVAVFDTAFHRTLPPAAALYPLPEAWTALGIRRYGFHGTSHKYCAQKAADLLGRPLGDLKLVTCHIGNGVSFTAIDGGQSVDTTMGFTPLEGLMMGARSGSIDPAILIYLQQTQGLTPDQLNQALNKASGLLGVSGLAADMRTILEAKAQGHERATLAYDLYIHRLRRYLGQMVGVLGGVDGLVFTAGVGENAPSVRADTCAAFGFLGLRLDDTLNNQSPPNALISHPDSTVPVLIIHTEEDWAIAMDCVQVLGN